ncbi:hypothetical protein [Maridesulfovibrio sp.]|uniref:hypothetical protein n=1 Tax=Maridesulfovibrio sp. TaxID=2795000 RepID=UPI0029CA6766|nr:hypothetical protein [Maridesulfovibrio sp.]
MKLRSLGIVKDILAAMGLNITHTYDDLVFVDHNAFMIQFDDENPSSLNIFFNIDCEKGVAGDLEQSLAAAAAERDFSIVKSGHFEISPKERSEEIEIKFLA